jgi:hypothetical protein
MSVREARVDYSPALARCNVGVDGVEDSSAKETLFVAHTRTAVFTFPPPCEGGIRGGWAAEPPHRQCIRRSPVKTSGNDTPPRSARPRTRRRPHRSIAQACLPRGLDVHRPTPLPPLHKGGKEKGALAEFAQRIGKKCKNGAIPTLRHPSPAPPSIGCETRPLNLAGF